MSRQRSPADGRFWAKVIRDEDGCWRWTGGKSHNGYGAFAPYVGDSPRRAHRFAYELLVGPIPAAMQLDHLCRNRACVNPAHLEVVTAKENIRRGGNNNRAKTHCPHGHEYTDANTYRYQSGRVCRICALSSQKAKSLKARLGRMAASGVRCKVCGHEWVPRSAPPKACPHPQCQSTRWAKGPKVLPEVMEVDHVPAV